MDRNFSLIAALVVIGAAVYAIHVYRTKKAAEPMVVTQTEQPMAESAPVAAAANAGADDIKGMQHLTKKADLDALVARSSKPVVVKVSATWCPPCQGMKPHYEAVAAELGDKFVFAEVDADSFEGKEALNVPGLPTVIIYKNGAEAGRFSGGTDAAGIKAELAKVA